MSRSSLVEWLADRLLEVYSRGLIGDKFSPEPYAEQLLDSLKPYTNQLLAYLENLDTETGASAPAPVSQRLPD